MEYPKKELAQLVIEYCVAYQIEHVIISPGSRNAPLTIGFVNHSKIKTYSIVDERCAAFFALGIAQQTRNPAVLVCTSGSALLNYYPAVAEAFYSDIPLVVISADRPKHLIDVGDGQTIRQENVFANHSEYNANLDTTISLPENTVFINEALQACYRRQGPVHINVPFDEPLYEIVDKRSILPVEINSVNDRLPQLDLAPFSKIWNSSSKKMILIGTCFPNEKLQQQLKELLKDESVLVLTETTSNLDHSKFIHSIDNLVFPLSEIEKKEFQPELLLTLGGMVISKRIKKILRNYSPKYHWHIDPKNAPDTYHCLSHHFQIDPTEFFTSFSKITQRFKSNYQQKWLTVNADREKRHASYLSKIDFSDLKVFDILVNTLPNTVLLQSGNSSVIRYLQLFKMNPNIHTFCNRGTSGIDGSTSTAVGASVVNKKQTVLITGDISFFYDSNALWNNYIKSNFRIILINNAGGGIFRIIPGPSASESSDYFETTHSMDAHNLSDMYGFEYSCARSEMQLSNCLTHFYDESKKPKILEIFTPKDTNDYILKEYFKYLV